MKYIDVSEWQGAVDWAKVKGRVDGVLLRAGYGKNHIDKCFVRNAKECSRLGIPIGAYWFSYAKTAQEARDEAGYLCDAVAPYRIELPLAFDFEYDSVANAKKCDVTVTRELCSGIVHAFCLEVERRGYWVLNYANPDFLSRYFDGSVASRYGLWLASWVKKPDLNSPPRKCAIWQWGGSTVDGISGTVDTNEVYTDFKALIAAAGCNRLNAGLDDGEGGEAYEYTAAKPQTDPAADALRWARAARIVEGDGETDRALALALWRYHAAFPAAAADGGAAGAQRG